MTSSYPLPDEYLTAIRNVGTQVLDPMLRQASACKAQSGRPLFYSGGFAIVFKLQTQYGAHALRCWTRDIGEGASHYQEIESHLRQVNLPYFVDFNFRHEGIMVKGQRYPTLRMDWLTDASLSEFIEDYRLDSGAMSTAAEAFLRMSDALQDANIAHGDLQADNIKVVHSGHTFDFKLIDYDTMYVPAMAGAPVLNSGLDSYQHPKRSSSQELSDYDDYFSGLVIYLTLKALAEKPDLWTRYPAGARDKELLFTGQDFVSSTPTALFHELYRLSAEVQRLTVILWNFTRCLTIRHLISLNRAVDLARTPVQPNGNGNPTGQAQRSTFDIMLQQRMNGGGARAGTGGAPNSWLDDSAFRGAPPPAAPPPLPQSTFSVGSAQRPVFSTNVASTPIYTATNGKSDAFGQLIQQRRQGGSQPTGKAPPPLPTGASVSQASRRTPPTTSSGDGVRSFLIAVWIIVLVIIFIAILSGH